MQLYALCDQELLDRRGVSLEAFVAICNRNNAAIIQYRNKRDDIATVKSSLITLRTLFDGYLIINDHYELISFCDGVHIGQEDLAAIDPDPKRAMEVLRSIVGTDKMVGLSTHNVEEIAIANELNLDYIGLGAYRNTATKVVDTVLGERLENIAATSVHPVAAIGGVRLDDRFEHVTYLVMGSALLEDTTRLDR